MSASRGAACDDGYEPNNTISQSTGPIRPGVPIIGTICPAGDQDFFKIQVAAVGFLTLQLGVPAGANYDLELFNSGGARVAFSYKVIIQQENLVYLATPGIYHARVFAAQGSRVREAYTLSGNWPSETLDPQVSVSLPQLRLPDDMPVEGVITAHSVDFLAKLTGGNGAARWLDVELLNENGIAVQSKSVQLSVLSVGSLGSLPSGSRLQRSDPDFAVAQFRLIDFGKYRVRYRSRTNVSSSTWSTLGAPGISFEVVRSTASIFSPSPLCDSLDKSTQHEENSDFLYFCKAETGLEELAPATTPLILIHGICGTECHKSYAKDYEGVWKEFIKAFSNDPLFDDLRKQYTPYIFRYETGQDNLVPGATDIPQVAAKLKTRMLQELPDGREVVIIAHSLGGLVARSFMQQQRCPDDNSPQCGVRVQRLITLASPHEGAALTSFGSFFGNGDAFTTQSTPGNSWLADLNNLRIYDGSGGKNGFFDKIYRYYYWSYDPIIPPDSGMFSILKDPLGTETFRSCKLSNWDTPHSDLPHGNCSTENPPFSTTSLPSRTFALLANYLRFLQFGSLQKPMLGGIPSTLTAGSTPSIWQQAMRPLETEGEGDATITWTWTDVANEGAYCVVDAGARGSLSVDLPLDTTYWIETGLAPNG